MKKYRLVVIFMLICLMLTSCYDAVEIDDEVYAISIGIDKGVSNKLRVTIQYPNYMGGGDKGGAGGGSSDKGKEEGQVGSTVVSSVEATTLLEALDLFNTYIARKISLTHTNMLVISEEFAREGIGQYVAPSARFREFRGDMQVIIVRGDAESFILENKSTIGENISKSEELMFTQSKNTGLFPKVNFHYFYSNMLSTYCKTFAVYAGVNELKGTVKEEPDEEKVFKTEIDVLPGNLPRRGAAKREFLGTAVFDGDRMVGYLTPSETRYFLMVTGKFEKGIISLEDPQKPGFAIPLDVRLGRRPKISTAFKDGKPVINFSVNLEADIGAIQSRINYEKVDRLNELNTYIESYIKSSIEQVIQKTQNQYNTDIFCFGKKIAGHFSTIREWESYDWLSHYKSAQVNVKVDVNIRRTGLMVRSLPIKGID